MQASRVKGAVITKVSDPPLLHVSAEEEGMTRIERVWAPHNSTCKFDELVHDVSGLDPMTSYYIGQFSLGIVISYSESSFRIKEDQRLPVPLSWTSTLESCR